MSASLESRFSMLPQMQEDRVNESTIQAHQAEQLSQRLLDTKVQAERIMKEEMDRTRSLELELIGKHPEWINWQRRRDEIQHQLSDWERSRMEERRRLEAQVKALKYNLESKKGQLLRMEEDQGRILQENSSLENERDRLKRELEDAKRGESDARMKYESISKSFKPLEEQIDGVERRMKDLHYREVNINPEIQKTKSEVQVIENLIKELESQFKSTKEECHSWEDRRNRAFLDISRASSLANEAQAAADEHRGMFDVLKGTMDTLEEKVKRAREAAQNALTLKNKAANLKIQNKERLTKLQNENDTLRVTFDEIQKKIDELNRQKEAVMSSINNNTDEIALVEYEVDCLQHDEDSADGLYKDAIGLEKLVGGGLPGSRDQYNAEVKLIESFLAKKRDAERERLEAESFLKDSESQLQNLWPRMEDYNNRLFELQRRLESERMRLGELEVERESLTTEKTNQQALFESLKSKLVPLREEMLAAGSMLSNCGQSSRQIVKRSSELEQRLKTLSNDFGPRIRDLGFEIAELERRIVDCEGQLSLNLYPESTVNPFTAQLDNLEQEKGRVRSFIMSEIQANPPEILVKQMSREAEAVMRAELAIGLCSRQQKIEDEAKELANVRPSNEPWIVLDKYATGKLFGEHLDQSDYGRIAKSVVELTEEHHIMAQ